MTPRGDWPERRRSRRWRAPLAGWRDEAFLRPGQLVRIVNISAHGALMECPGRLRPGRRAELQLLADEGEGRVVIGGELTRCEVVRLKPLCFQAVIEFEARWQGADIG
jgi:hypothetical protein